LRFILLIFFILIVQLNALGVEKSGPYSFSALPADSAIVKYLFQVLTEKEEAFKKVFHDSLQQVTIYLPPSDRDYFKLIGDGLPDWSGGVAFPAQRAIVLRPVGYFDRREYREVLLHELAHICMAEKDKSSRIPLWFNEGVAMLMSGKTFTWDDHVILGTAVVTDKLLGLEEMEKMLTFGLTEAQLAYAQSLLAVQLLTHEYGEEIIGRLLDGLTDDESWEQIFERCTGNNSDQFAQELQAYIQKEYRWAFLLQLKNLFWIAVTLLVLGGFIVIKIRNRRIMSEWEKNESI
jgi:hypothetical protein